MPNTLLLRLMGRAGLVSAPVDDHLDGSSYEKQFNGADPDDADIPGSNEDTDPNAPAATPAPPAPAPAAPAAPAAPTPPAPAPGAPAPDGSDPVDPPAATPAPPAADPAAAPAAEPAAAPEQDPGDYRPQFEPPARTAPEDAEQRMTALATEQDEAFKKYNDGELDLEGYQEVQRRVRTETQALSRQIATDDARHAAYQERVMERFQGVQAEAIRELQRAGIKMAGDTLGEFQGLVKFYAGQAAQRGMSDVNDLEGSRWALTQAKRAFAAQNDVTLTAAAPKAPAPAPAAKPPAPAAPAAPAAQKQTPADRQVNRGDLPPTLANAPLAGAATPGGDPFAHIDSLEGSAQERAIAAMSPADQAAYLSR